MEVHLRDRVFGFVNQISEMEKLPVQRAPQIGHDSLKFNRIVLSRGLLAEVHDALLNWRQGHGATISLSAHGIDTSQPVETIDTFVFSGRRKLASAGA